MRKNNYPKWIKLDNAATLYPSTLTKKYAAMFRVTATLNDKIDENILKIALENTMKRFPVFSYTLKKGVFWWYFKFIDGTPKITEDYKNPMVRINFKENNGFMFRIRYFDKRIAVEFFHALTDATGGITFLLTLTAEYLRLKEKIRIRYTDKILNLKQNVSDAEYEDCFNTYARGIGKKEYEKPAFHQKGRIIDNHKLNIVTGIVPIDSVKSICYKYNTTITELFVSLMIESLQEIQEKENKKKKKPIKIMVPVNLRKFYKTKTLRNFITYVNITIDTNLGHYSLEEIITEVKNQMKLMVTEKRLNAKISGNVNLSQNLFIRLTPMFLKKHFVSMGEKIKGDRYCTTSFSNIGLIDIPGSMNKYVKELGFIIGKSRGKPGTCACVGVNGKLYLSFSRKIKESDYERIFFRKLVEMKIPVEIESNEGI